jgi:outer membrane protein assembly factor BamA
MAAGAGGGSNTAGRRVRACVLALLSILVLGACAARGPGVERYPQFAEYDGERIQRVRFLDPAPFSADSLQALIRTEPTRCNILGFPICVPLTRIGRQTRRLDLNVLANDVDRLTNFYRRRGYFGTTVLPDVERVEEDRLRISFEIMRTPAIWLDTLVLSGTEGIANPDSLLRLVPLQPGNQFDLDEFSRSADFVLNALRDRGYAFAELLRSYSVNPVGGRATAELEAVAGPQVVVDSIIVLGAERLRRIDVLRQITFGTGDLLVFRELVESHRNLYNLELVQLATVRVAPDTLQLAPGDSTRATVEVSVAEAPPRQIDVAAGYGNVECIRAEAQWVNRSFLGGARRLQLRGSVSRIGIAGPVEFVGGTICPERGEEAFGDLLDYSVGAQLTQPYVRGPRNSITVDLFAERISEPQVFQREAQGARALLNRRVAPRTLLSTGIDAERSSTRAAPALVCAAFLVCEPAAIAILQEPQWRNSLSANLVRDRTDVQFDPTRGYVARTALGWATPLLASEVRFLRFTAEGSRYTVVWPRWVGAASLRVGTFFETATLDPLNNFVPPGERFFAGGASTVRGFERNGLGPGVYVTDRERADPETGMMVPDRDAAEFIPIGGTLLGVANAEVRFPSPWLSNLLRLAVFVDAGTIGEGQLWDLAGADWRITPGAGIRFVTPVGPVRLDVGFNPHDQRTGPLYFSEPGPAGRLIRVEDAYRPPARAFYDRFRVHVGIGQAF